METEADAASSGERKKIEALFGAARRILSMVRLRLRGLTGARDGFLLTATFQNLKRLAKTTATADDGLINAGKPHPTSLIT